MLIKNYNKHIETKTYILGNAKLEFINIMFMNKTETYNKDNFDYLLIIKQSLHQKIEAMNWRFHALPYPPYFSKLQFIVPQGIGLTGRRISCKGRESRKTFELRRQLNPRVGRR